MNHWRNLDETYREYSSALTDNKVRFWRSRSERDIGVVNASMLMLGHRSPSSLALDSPCNVTHFFVEFFVLKWSVLPQVSDC